MRLWLAVVLLGLALSPLAAQAQTGNEEPICTQPWVLYCDNFEDRTVGYAASPTWDKKYKSGPFGHSVVGGTPNLSVSTTRAFSGSKSMQLTTPQGYASGGFMDTDFQAGGIHREIYYRAYEYWAPDYYFSGEATKNWHLRDTKGTQNAYMHFPGGSNQMDQFSYSGSPMALYQNTNAPPVGIVGGRWYCLELHVKGSTGGSANGVVEGWIDGVQKWNYPAVVHQADAAFTGLLLVTYWNCTAPNPCPSRPLTRWIDNIVVATQRIGCLGSTPPPTTQTYTLTATASGAGTVTGAGSYPSGTAVTPVAVAASGSTFSGWSGDCSGTGACTVTMTANKTVTATFTTPTTPPPTTNLPPAPSSPTVTLGTTDPSGVTFNVAWPAVATATSYSYTAGLSDNSSNLQGTVTPPNLLLKTPYMANGAEGSGFVCIKSVNAAGSSADGACNSLAIPAKPAVIPPTLTTGTLTADAQISRCTYFLTSEPPDATGGWVAQFYYDGSKKVGNPVSAAPYKRTVELFAPSHSFSVQFTKSGQVMRSPAVVTRACP